MLKATSKTCRQWAGGRCGCTEAGRQASGRQGGGGRDGGGSGALVHPRHLVLLSICEAGGPNFRGLGCCAAQGSPGLPRRSQLLPQRANQGRAHLEMCEEVRWCQFDSLIASCCSVQKE